MPVVKIGPKHQITIPREVFDSLRLEVGDFDPPRDVGDPKSVPIPGTTLHYAANTALPVIQVSRTSNYAVENAVWFVAPSPLGPWAVATSVPTVIYTIPPSSPVHYVTYVRVYQVTPTVVVVGYTPGYYGSCVSHGVVVYGTGYVYPPYVGTTVWYGAPVTYGFGVAVTYTPWTGGVYGFGFGWSWGAVTVGWGWGPYPWWGSLFDIGEWPIGQHYHAKSRKLTPRAVRVKTQLSQLV